MSAVAIVAPVRRRLAGRAAVGAGILAVLVVLAVLAP